jgi:hypothetical protein
MGRPALRFPGLLLACMLFLVWHAIRLVGAIIFRSTLEQYGGAASLTVTASLVLGCASGVCILGIARRASWSYLLSIGLVVINMVFFWFEKLLLHRAGRVSPLPVILTGMLLLYCLSTLPRNRIGSLRRRSREMKNDE